MNYGFFKAACASPDVTVADCKKNADNIITCIHQAADRKTSLIVFPELCITGYTCGELFLQKVLQKSAAEELERIAEATSGNSVLTVIGLPLPVRSSLYNCAAVLFKGKILAFIPKTFIPNYSEFYERRYFTPAPSTGVQNIFFSEKFPAVPFGTDILIMDPSWPDFVLAIEICEDVWVPSPPSARHALAGATVIANLSASNELIGKASYRRLLVTSQSARLTGAYLYADAGHGESTQDLVFASHNLIAENGTILAESQLFSGESIYADIDLERLMQERRKTTTFGQNAAMSAEAHTPYVVVNVDFSCLTAEEAFQLERFIDPHPFVPADTKERSERCRAVITLQAEGLAKRLRHIHAKTAVLGLSGGLDSTLALLVTCRAFDLCGAGRKGIRAVTMPCFGTTDRTYHNACVLAKLAGAELKEISIEKSVLQHFLDIGQDEHIHDITYENSQARERTQVLMDLANKNSGIVIGTGDLSELALGWATYNGDHMSMYGVNSSIPKTLVRYLVSWFAEDAEQNGQHELSEVLRDILATPVSPELIPPENGTISQKTEEIVGPYELHDFFLFYVLRFGFSPSKILYLAEQAFNGSYDRVEIFKWLRSFYRRFFSQQFKRSCMPDGAKVGTVNLSPRGDWRMPSDASASAWLSELDAMEHKEKEK